MNRTLTLGTALLVSALALTACAAETTPMPSPSPSMSASMKPTETATTSPGATTSTGPAAMSTAVTDVDTARQASEEVEDELEQLSEVTDAEVVIAGNEAAIGLTFDGQYQAGITDRMREMVKERMDSVVSGITKIAITDDATMIKRIDQLDNQLENATDLTDIENKLTAIVNEIGTTTGNGTTNKTTTNNNSAS